MRILKMSMAMLALFVLATAAVLLFKDQLVAGYA